MPYQEIKIFGLVFFLSSVIFFQRCDLPPHYSKEEVPVTDTVYIDSSSIIPEGEDPTFIPDFEKLDYRVLEALFHSDTIGKGGYIYWNPTVDEMLDPGEYSSLCSTRIEDVYYFSGAKNKWAFLLFITYDELAGKQLPASAPVIGGALFKRTPDNMWTLKNINKTIRRHGEMGELHPYSYEMYGKFSPALHLKQSYTATGISSEYDYYYDLRSMKEIFSFHSGQTNAPQVKEKDPQYYKYSSKITFVKPVPESSLYDDLKVESGGTGSDPSTDSVYIIKAVQIYHYNLLRGIYEPACE